MAPCSASWQCQLSVTCPRGQRHLCLANESFLVAPHQHLVCSDSCRRRVFCVLIKSQGRLFFPSTCPVWSGAGDAAALGCAAHFMCGRSECSHTACKGVRGELCMGWGTAPRHPAPATGQGWGWGDVCCAPSGMDSSSCPDNALRDHKWCQIQRWAPGFRDWAASTLPGSLRRMNVLCDLKKGYTHVGCCCDDDNTAYYFVVNSKMLLC